MRHWKDYAKLASVSVEDGTQPEARNSDEQVTLLREIADLLRTMAEPIIALKPIEKADNMQSVSYEKLRKQALQYQEQVLKLQAELAAERTKPGATVPRNALLDVLSVLRTAYANLDRDCFAPNKPRYPISQAVAKAMDEAASYL